MVSMRPYRKQNINLIRNMTRKYSSTHGESICWGWEAPKALGISDIDELEWVDSPPTLDGRRLGELCNQDAEEVPVFWGCGVTPQEAMMRAGLTGTVMAHVPGHMLVLDAVAKTWLRRDTGIELVEGRYGLGMLEADDQALSDYRVQISDDQGQHQDLDFYHLTKKGLI